MMRRIVVFTLVVLAVGAWARADNPRRLVQLDVASQTEKVQVGRLINLEEGTRGLHLVGWATEKELAALSRAGFAYDFVTSHRTPEALTMCTDPDGPPFDPPASWNCYPTYAQYVDLMEYYAATYPSLCRLIDLGVTQDGDHHLLVLKISDNPDAEEDEPEFFYTATMHGDETTGYVLTLRLADELLTKYATDSEIADIVDNMVVWINPLANPDGTFAGGDSTVAGSVRELSNGHDPNRSFPDPSAGDDPSSGGWDPEVQEMIDFADSQSIAMSVNFHGGAEVVNYPWDEWSARHPDDAWYQAVSHVYADDVHAAAPTGYMDGFDDGITDGWDWYQVNGGRQDYMNYYKGCREVTIELSDSKTLDSNQLEAHWGYNRQAMLDYMKQALYGIRGVVTDQTTGEPVAATVKVVGHDDDSYRTFAYTDPDVGDYHRPIEAGTWDLQFSADGYQTKTVASIVAIDGATTVQDVQLVPLASYAISGLVTDAATNSPIAGATVSLTDTAFGAETTTGTGAYAFADVWEGSHTLEVAANGYGHYQAAIDVNASSTVFDVALAAIQTVFGEDFETGDGGFTPTGSWQWGTDAVAGAASGSKVWGTVLGADYGVDNADWTLDSAEIAIPAAADTAELVYSHWYETESGYDGGQVLISVDGGPFTLLTPTGGYPDSDVDGLGHTAGYSGTGTGWQEVRADLAAFIGHTVVVRWRFGSDVSINYYRGWYVDDVQIVTTGAVDTPLFADDFEDGTTDAWAVVQ